MCGIVSILNIRQQTQELRGKALKMSQKIRHRGPDWSGVYCGGSAILAHERLSIVDPESGRQPLYSPDRKLVLAVNGEIYNHQDIRRRYAGQYDFQTGSDCEVILALYRDKGIDFLEELNGIFAFVLYGIDKAKAKRGAWRIPEATLLLVAFLGGSLGALLGMEVFRHKTKHARFRILIPLFMILHIALAVYMVKRGLLP